MERRIIRRKGGEILKKHDLKLLILDDADMNCDTKTADINKMGIEDIGLSMFAIQNYDLVIYEGVKGSKILKSKYTKKGVIL